MNNVFELQVIAWAYFHLTCEQYCARETVSKRQCSSADTVGHSGQGRLRTGDRKEFCVFVEMLFMLVSAWSLF